MVMMIAVSMVAISAKAVSGPYRLPSHSETTSANTNCAVTATYGDRLVGWTLANADGSSRILPIAYQVRVVALAAALALAIAELAMARNTTTQPAPHTWRASPSHGLPFPNFAKPAILSGPKKTVAA